jgi:hypothetical protein
MSAAAPALAKAPRRVAAVRLGDTALPVAYVSVIFGLLLFFFPVTFPRIILKGWQNGDLTLVMMALPLLLDAYIYFRVAYMLSAKPTILAGACIGSLPIIVVVGLNFLLQSAIAQTIAESLPNVQGRIVEEILAHTYLGLVSSIFLPFLVIRQLQQLRDRKIASGMEPGSPTTSTESSC